MAPIGLAEDSERGRYRSLRLSLARLGIAADRLAVGGVDALGTLLAVDPLSVYPMPRHQLRVHETLLMKHVICEARTQTRSLLDQHSRFLGGHELPQLAEFVQITEDFDADRLIDAADGNGGEAARLN